MQISPIATLDDETNQIREMTARIVADQIIPNEHLLRLGARSGGIAKNVLKRYASGGSWDFG